MTFNAFTNTFPSHTYFPLYLKKKKKVEGPCLAIIEDSYRHITWAAVKLVTLKCSEVPS